MKVLFIGGTGIISTACTALAAERGVELTLLVRGEHEASVPPGVRTLKADISDPASVEAALGRETFDSIVDWVAYAPADIERDIALFRGRTGQYVFISSASAYQKPPSHYCITETTPLANPFWEYSRNKIACEERLLRAQREEGFPVTIVRPSLTYGDTQIPLAVNSWLRPYTAIARMRAGKKIIVPGDGTSLWVCTHNSDFAVGFLGLLGRADAVGETFQITSDEVLTWNQITHLTAAAAGAEPRIVHIASDFITACIPDEIGSLTGDKSNSAVFDNAKIKRFVPDFASKVAFAEGIVRTIAWFDADPRRQVVDEAADAAWDKLIAAYEHGLGEAVRAFQG